MKICVPVENNKGLDSKPFGHFGSAPSFVVCDLETGDLKHIFSVAALGVQSGDEVTVTIEGPDEEKAALVMKEVFEQRF